jgi:hypothetical protein
MNAQSILRSTRNAVVAVAVLAPFALAHADTTVGLGVTIPDSIAGATSPSFDESKFDKLDLHGALGINVIWLPKAVPMTAGTSRNVMSNSGVVDIDNLLGIIGGQHA